VSPRFGLYGLDLDRLSKDEVRALCKDYYSRICQIESAKYDMEKEVDFKDYKV